MKFIKVIFCLFISNLIFSQNINNEDSIFYKEFLEHIQSKYIYKSEIDWKQFEKQVYKSAQISKDSAIITALKLLNNPHTYYKTKEGKTIRGAYKQNFPLLDNKVGYLKITAFTSEDIDLTKKYINKITRHIEKNKHLNYWIIDLRDNKGGNMWPMFISLTAFYNEGTLGYFKTEEGKWIWKKEAGKIFSHTTDFTSKYLGEPIINQIKAEKIFVLINENTLSAGEAVAISLKSIKNTFFIGTKTGGFSTGNKTIKLSNGDELILTRSQMLDIDSKDYDKGIAPDIKLCDSNDIEEYILNQIK